MYHRSYYIMGVDLVPLCKKCRYCSTMYHRSYSAMSEEINPLWSRAVRCLFSGLSKLKSPLVSLVAFKLLEPGKQPTHSSKPFSHSKISKSVKKEEQSTISNSTFLLNNILAAISEGISSGQKNYQSTTSWSKDVGKSVASNVISTELKEIIGNIGNKVLSNVIEEAVKILSYTASNIMMIDSKDIVTDCGVGPTMAKLTELKLMIELMKSGKQPTRTYDASKIWNEIIGFESETTFTVFAIAFQGQDKKFAHVTVIPDKELDLMMNHPIFAPYVKDIMSFFVR